MKTMVLPNGMKLSDSLSELVEAMKKTPDKFDPIVRKYALKIQAEAARDAPVKTGALKNSIVMEEVGKNSYIVKDGVEYGIYQELGTSRGVSAKHFLGGACERNADEFISELKGAMNT